MKFSLLVIHVFAFLFVKAQYGQSENDLLKVAKSLNKKEGRVTVYYPTEFEKQAIMIQALVEKASTYYNDHLKINIPVSVALFGPKEFERFTKEKWGQPDPYNTFLPFVAAGPPTVMCLPASSGSALDSFVQKAIKNLPLKKLNLSATEVSNRFTAFVGLHELGHQYMNELEISQPIHWFQEMMANFIADAFLTDSAASDGQLWQLVNEAFVSNLKPTNIKINGIGNGTQENYVWWQGNLTLQAHEVYKKKGFEFLRQLRELNNVKIFSDNLAFLIALEQIAPGFEQWAEKRGHISEDDKIKMESIRHEIARETRKALSSKMPYPFTRTYSTDWSIASDSVLRTVMVFLKGFETNHFDSADVLANYIELSLPDAVGFYEKAKAIIKLQELRNGFNKPKIRLQSAIPLISDDRNEQWVIVNGRVTFVITDGTLNSIDFCQQFRVSKEGKINYIKEFNFLPSRKQ